MRILTATRFWMPVFLMLGALAFGCGGDPTPMGDDPFGDAGARPNPVPNPNPNPNPTPDPDLVHCAGGVTIGSAFDIEEFAGCQYIDDNLSVASERLVDLAGLESIVWIEGVLRITRTESLTSLRGLENLVHVGGLHVDDNEALETLDGLTSLSSIDRGVRLDENPLLRDISALSGLSGELESITVNHHEVLASLYGLHNITFVNGDLSLFNNDAIVDLAGLDSLAAIEGELDVSQNDALTTLAGVISLTEIRGDVDIEYNPLLPQCEVDHFLDTVPYGGRSTTSNNDEVSACF